MEPKKRGRKSIEVDPIQFQAIVAQLESTNTFANRSQLWNAVAATDWATTISLSAQSAMQKADKLAITVNTPKGKRGRQKGDAPVAIKGPRKPRDIHPAVLQDLINGIPSECRDGLEKTIIKASKGSLKASIKLKCMDCVGYVRGEVKMCEMTACPNWSVRPYKDKENDQRIVLALIKEQENELSVA
jgi:hypothetical protein